MAEESLVKELREDGWKIYDEIKRQGIPTTAVFWTFVENDDEWRFVVATSLSDREGSLAAYKKVRVALQNVAAELQSDISLRNIAVIDSHNLAVDNLRRFHGKVPDHRDAKTHRVSISRDDPYVYVLH